MRSASIDYDARNLARTRQTSLNSYTACITKMSIATRTFRSLKMSKIAKRMRMENSRDNGANGHTRDSTISKSKPLRRRGEFWMRRDSISYRMARLCASWLRTGASSTKRSSAFASPSNSEKSTNVSGLPSMSLRMLLRLSALQIQVTTTAKVDQYYTYYYVISTLSMCPRSTSCASSAT